MDGAGTRHVTVYRADETGYHVLEMRQEKNIIKIKEKKPRKPKKNGSRRAKVEAQRASKLGRRGWRYNSIDDVKTKVLNPVSERTSIIKVNKNDIPELVRSFTPTTENNFVVDFDIETLPLKKSTKTKSSDRNNKNRSRFSNIKLVPKVAVPKPDITVRNRPSSHLKEGDDPISDLSALISGFQKKNEKSQIIKNRPILEGKKKPALDIVDLIPASKVYPDSIESVIPKQKNQRIQRPKLKSWKGSLLDLIPLKTKIEPLEKKDGGVAKESINLVTLPPVTTPRPRIHRPILTKNERENGIRNFNEKSRTKIRKNKPRINQKNRVVVVPNVPKPILGKGAPPIVISTTNLPVSRDVPNPIFEDSKSNKKASIDDARKKKENEIIEQIKRQLYEVLGQKRKENYELNGPSKGKQRTSITSKDIAGILSNVGLTAPASNTLRQKPNKNKKLNKNPPKELKKKKIRVVKSRPRVRRPIPKFANFGLVEEFNKNQKERIGNLLSKAKVKTNSLLNKIPGISEENISDRKNPNRRRKLLKVIKKLRPQKLRRIPINDRELKVTKDNDAFNSSPLFNSPLLPSHNTILAGDAGVNSVANKVLLQAVLETENNVGGDVEESIQSQIVITPKGTPQNGITVTRVEKIGSEVISSQKIADKSNGVSVKKIVLPAPGSLKLRQPESRSSTGDGKPKKIYTLPPRVLQPIGFVHPTFSLSGPKSQEKV